MIKLKSLLLMESFEAIGPDELTPEQYDQLNQMVKDSGINILSDKELVTVYLVDDNVAAGLWTSITSGAFSFDVIVGKAYQNQKYGSRLIKTGIQRYQELASEDPSIKLELDVVNEKLVKPLERLGLVVYQKVGGHTIMGYPQEEAGDPDIKAVAEMNIPADDHYQPSEGEAIERVVWGIQEGQDIKTSKLSVLGLEGDGHGVYGIHVTSDPEYWLHRAGEDFSRDPSEARIITIFCVEGDMYVEDPQYVTDPDTGIKASSFVLLTKRNVLKYGKDWEFK